MYFIIKRLDNTYVACRRKERYFWKKYNGQKVKEGRPVRYGYNTYGRGFCFENVNSKSCNFEKNGRKNV